MKDNEFIVRGAIEKIASKSLRPENGRVTSIGELSRLTGLPAYAVLGALDLGIRLNGWVAETINTRKSPDPKKPTGILDVRPSKAQDRIRSKLEGEGQRYQRRAQIPPPGSRGKPVSEKVNQRTIKSQVNREKVVLQPRDISRTKVERDRLEEKKRLKRAARFTVYGSSRPDIEARQSADKLLNILSSRSVAPFQRPSRIKELVSKSIQDEIPVTLVNWICPPGTPLEANDQGEVFRRYVGVSPEAGFKADYRLLPRLKLEEELLRSFRRANLQSPDYFKIVADDNPFCLYPLCLALDGKEQTLQTIAGYSDYVQSQLDKLLGKNQACTTTFSRLLGPKLFQEMLQTYASTSFKDLQKYLPEDVLETELDVLVSHTKPNLKLIPLFETYTKNVVRQYAVEGLYLYKLFGDNVIMAWNESTRRTASIDSLRTKYGLPPIPKIFVLHEKKDGKIYEDY